MALNRTMLHEQIKDVLLARILEGVYAPGQRIVELQVAQEFGVSQAPVREALRELEALRLSSPSRFAAPASARSPRASSPRSTRSGRRSRRRPHAPRPSAWAAMLPRSSASTRPWARPPSARRPQLVTTTSPFTAPSSRPRATSAVRGLDLAARRGPDGHHARENPPGPARRRRDARAPDRGFPQPGRCPVRPHDAGTRRALRAMGPGRDRRHPRRRSAQAVAFPARRRLTRRPAPRFDATHDSGYVPSELLSIIVSGPEDLGRITAEDTQPWISRRAISPFSRRRRTASRSGCGSRSGRGRSRAWRARSGTPGRFSAPSTWCAWPARGDAGDGGQGDAVQGVRRRRRVPAVPRHQGRRRDRRRS